MLKRDPNATQPKFIYLNRRHFLVKTIPMAAGAILLAACSPEITPVAPTATANPSKPQPTVQPTLSSNQLPSTLGQTEPFSNVAADELGDLLESVLPAGVAGDLFIGVSDFSVADWLMDFAGRCNQRDLGALMVFGVDPTQDAPASD